MMTAPTPIPVRSPLRGVVGRVAALLGRWYLGEPAVVVPRRDAERWAELDRRERLRQAEPTDDADETVSDEELARLRLTEADRARLAPYHTPLEDWPDEDITALFGPVVAQQLLSSSKLPEIAEKGE